MFDMFVAAVVSFLCLALLGLLAFGLHNVF